MGFVLSDSKTSFLHPLTAKRLTLEFPAQWLSVFGLFERNQLSTRQLRLNMHGATHILHTGPSCSKALISANPRLKFYPGFFIPLLESLSLIIFSLL